MKSKFVGMLLLSMLFPLNSIAQEGIIVYDTLFSEPVTYVRVFDNESNELLGMTNETGFIHLERSRQVRLERRGYATKVTLPKDDTLFIHPVWQELEGITVKPVDKLKLYDAILDKSQSVLAKNVTHLEGIYVEAGMVVDMDTRDTLYFEKSCELRVTREVVKKDIDYSFSARNGHVTQLNTNETHSFFQRTMENQKDLNSLLTFVPDLESYLKYDLSKKKRFNIKGVDEKDVTRTIGLEISQLRFDRGQEDKSISSEYRVNYKDSILYSFESSYARGKEQGEKGIAANFARNNMLLDYTGLPENYGLSGVLSETVVELTVGEGHYRIFAVKLFQPNNRVASGKYPVIEDLDSFFEQTEAEQGRSQFYEFTDLTK